MKAVLLLSAALLFTLSPSATSADENSSALVATVDEVANKLQARMGFAAYDLQTGQRWEYQANQRYPMSSTFKTLACAALLHRVDTGAERLGREVGFSEVDLVTYSPVTEIFAGRQAMTLSGLCEAALTTSDNTAANLILQALGGPEALTAFVKTTLEDDVTRLDRWETALNDATPGDPRDTTTPNAMVKNLDKLLFGEVLSTKSKDQLRDWLVRNQVSDELFRVSIPPGWIIADRTGAGGFGSRSITAIIWPPKRQPIIVALYITQTEASFTERNAAIALIGAAIVAEIKP